MCRVDSSWRWGGTCSVCGSTARLSAGSSACLSTRLLASSTETHGRDRAPPFPIVGSIDQADNRPTLDRQLCYFRPSGGPAVRASSCPGALQAAGEPRGSHGIVPDAVPHERVALQPEHLLPIAIPPRREVRGLRLAIEELLQQQAGA